MELHLTVAVPATGARADVAVAAPAGAVLGDVLPQLLATVGRTTATLTVDGHPVNGSALLGHPPLVHGAVLAVDACPSRPYDGAPRLLLVGGPDAGAVHPLTGDVVVGRAGDVVLTDQDASRVHCRLRVAGSSVSVLDLASTNGTQVDGARIDGEHPLREGVQLRLGNTTCAVLTGPPATAPAIPSYDGTLRVNRPPRLRPRRSDVRIVVPAPPAVVERSPLPVLSVLLPLVLGVVMWRVLGNATFLLFTLLSPMVAVGTVVTERRSGRRRSRTQQAQWQAARDGAERELADAVRADVTSRRAAAPDAAALLGTAAGPGPRLWERRPGDDDALDLRLGLADRPADVQVEGDPPEGATTARSVPVVVPLRAVGALGVCGPPDPVRALARSLVTQAAVLHSPRDLQLVVLTDATAAAHWEWARWLPHTSPDSGQDCLATVGLSGDQVTARVAELLDTRRRTVLLVLDGARALRSVRGLAALLADGPAMGVHTIALDADLRLLPAECGATVEVGTTGRLHVRLPGQDPLELPGDLVSTSYAETVARALAPLREERVEQLDGLPTSVRWTDVAALPLTGTEDDVTRVLERWASGGPTTAARLGRAAEGAFTVDLATDGPHALVAGTTGAGKSELLQSLVASLVAGSPPDRLQLVLVDYKGGAAFGPCRDLPHTVGLVTDLDGALVERALTSLTAELRRREQLLALTGAKDVDDHQRRGGALARLVIVVDEFAALAVELPDFVRGLVSIAQRGRSLGVHLVLATQRPEGVVSADIRANTNLRLCLAVTRETESRDVIDSPVAATISRGTPGRCYARTGHAALAPFQVGRIGGRRPVDDAAMAPVVRLVPAAELGDPVATAVAREDDEVTDLALLVAACRAATERLGLPAAPSPWLAPLPDLLTLDDVEGAGFGLLDVPEEQARRPLAFAPDTDGHLLVAGTGRSGRTTAVRTLAGVLARTHCADDLHLYALDFGGGLGPLACLPHTGAVVPREQPQRMERVLAWLTEEVARRQALLGAAGHAGVAEQRAAVAAPDRLPHLVLLLDGWEAFVAAFQDVDGGRAVDLGYRLLREGPAAGLHLVVTSDRGGLVGRLASMVDRRVVLRLADRGDYAAAGVPTRLVPDVLPAGRGWSLTPAALVTQVALLDADPAGPAQAAALQRIAETAAAPRHHPPRRVALLPTAVTLASLPRGPGTRVALGVGGDEPAPLLVDLADGFLVAGPPRSGRSSALLAVSRQIDLPVVAVAPRASPLRDLPGCVTDVTAAAELEALLAGPPVALLLDDAELLVDSPLAPLLERVVRRARDTGSVVVAAGTTDDLLTGYRGFVVDLRRSRSGVLLAARSPADGDLLGVRLSRNAIGDLLPGRGLLVRRGRVEPLQLALPD